jgi:Prasinovirus endonuclease VII
MIKQCSKCGEFKIIPEFRRRNEASSKCGYRSACKTCLYESEKLYAQKNRSKVNAKSRRRYWRNPKRSILYSRMWRKKNPDKCREQGRRRARIETTILNRKIRKRLRTRLLLALSGGYKRGSTIELLGCSIADFKIYLESKFESGMSWENYGCDGWHIDHIMPCAIFDLTKPEHQKRCFHFSNMQPMWAGKNLRKSAKVITDQFNLL